MEHNRLCMLKTETKLMIELTYIFHYPVLLLFIIDMSSMENFLQVRFLKSESDFFFFVCF